jgi:hypothetical protein
MSLLVLLATALATAFVSATEPGGGGPDAAVRPGATGPATARAEPPAPASHAVRPKKIYAHYMGCYPVAAAATAYHRENDAHKIRHDGKGQFDAIGDRWRNWPLVPDGLKLNLEQSADLDIRRALRAGIDGFAIDAWAGGQGAKDVFDALIKVARDKDYPFEVTICLDPGIQSNWDLADAIRYIVQKHGDNPKLARRNGKPLIFGYLSSFIGFRHGAAVLKQRPEYAQTDPKALPNLPALRQTEKGWQLMADGLLAMQKQAGCDLFFQFCMHAFFHQVPNGTWKQDDLVRAAGFMGKRFGAVGEFLGGGPTHDRMAAAVKAAGAEWSEPMFFQYENIGWGGNRISMGFDILRDRWQHARANDSTLIQFVTWNDYTENTCLAPAYDTRYAVLDLNAHFVQWWKTGREPAPDHDRVYLSYRKYPKGAKLFPFKPKQPDAGGMLEVLTLLPRPAKIHLPGREAEYDAPAGMSWRQFELKPGLVAAEVVRDGRVDARLESPEPITDRPFREQNGMTCYSTEFLRHWKADFGGAPPLVRGEYADDDHDGLPNWFEMYWFGKFLDWTTATAADPKALGKGGKTKCLWEYDGMMKVELDLAPAGGGQVDEFELVIPVKAHLATLLHSTTAIRSNPSMEIPIGKGVVWDSRSMVQTLGKGSFIPYIWIGGAERGVCWFADNDKGWITDDKELAIEVERAGDIVNLRVRFVNKPGVVKAPRRIVFGLMATPVKPIPAESRAWWGDSASPRSFVDHLPSWRFAGFSDKETLDPLGGDFSIFQYFAKHQGTGKAPTDAEKVLGDWMRKNGLEPEKKGGPFGDLKQGFSRTVANSDIAFYTNPALEDGGTPQGRQFNNEWHGGVSGMGCNFVKSYNDYAAWCYDQILATGLKCGMYQDNTFPVASTDVIAGGAYVREDGSIQAGWNIFGHREFYKRLFVVGWERMGRLPLIYPHTTNGMTIPLFSFATIHLALEWEQGSLRTFQEKFKFPLLRTEVMGKQAGMIPRVLCGMWDGAADLLLNGYLHRTREGVGLLHDSYPRGLQPYIGNVIKELIPLGFHKESCEFIGYWDKPAGVKAPEGTEVSLFKMEKGVLAVVVDTSGKDGARRVAFDAKALRREIKTIRDFEADLLAAKQADPKAGKQYKPDYKAYDAMWVYYPPTDRAFKAVDGRTVEFNLRRHDYALLLAE